MANRYPYEPVLSSKAAAFVISLSKLRQRKLIELLHQLAKNPSQIGDYSERDNTGREVQFIAAKDLVITFWADDAVREFRIVDIEEV
jgi:hypothetical protein